MDYDYLKKLVREEAKGLRESISDVQRYKLNEKTFNPNSATDCIYGQLTGIYNSSEAVELAKKAGVVFVLDRFLGGSCRTTAEKLELYNEFKSNFRITPIESYIVKNVNDGKRILRYIKGTTKTLRLMDN